MATGYSEIYSSFLSKITDYSFLSLEQDVLETQMEMYLKSSIPKFRFPRVDLSDVDDTNKSFNTTLSPMEIEILATLMLHEYLKPLIATQRLTKQSMTDKEFRFYSQANHLAELIELSDNIKREAEKLILDYSYEAFVGDE